MDRLPERRSAIRIPIPIGCELDLLLPGESIPIASVCVELGVGGMTIHSHYIPRMDEEFELMLRPPAHGGFAPMHARVQVKRCHPLDANVFEIGVQILEVLA